MKWHIKTISRWKYNDILPPDMVAGHVRMVYYKVLWIKIPVAYYATGTFCVYGVELMYTGYNHINGTPERPFRDMKRHWVKLKP